MPDITVKPSGAPLDTPLAILVEDLPPGESVTVRFTTGDRCAEAVFVADDRGVVDLRVHAPVRGSYSGVDAMGLFWSTTATGDEPGPERVVVAGVGEVELDRRRVPEGVKRTEVSENGLVGVLFEPDDGVEHPGVIVLGGSEGGLHELDAALLAGHGFAALALAYFGVDGVPEYLVDIPLEYVGTAIAYLKKRTTGVGLVGGSRGGELALLAGAAFPDVKAVVSVVGSGVVTQCIGPGDRLLDKIGLEAASWTWEGRPLPYLPYSVPDELRARIVDGRPVALRLAFDLADGIPADVEIPVERIEGGVLLLSAADDESWPCTDLSDVAYRRLKDSYHPHEFEHVVYPGAGHLIAGPPYRSTSDVLVPGPGVTFALGGMPALTAAAKADAWRRTVEFFTARLAT
ncbi:acyl-CoA thioester hydrolase/BAAT C-terminal domain-containing protein [Saccharothrix violaceirubra]|uniref:Dienelactone hydrolase n=1 Tax=Saccharothrix violaceirubra TaxID=413306 RepID=A0A7W7WUB2_9PSEU|nr:acyl-CoA thioester hydrolase/BAAT C-terminal domain-containing protein [Saccharothrix violaceirubra]MBB4963572.1 dienelactone hydrolase [Saccharothrix violaceirubra]